MLVMILGRAVAGLGVTPPRLRALCSRKMGALAGAAVRRDRVAALGRSSRARRARFFIVMSKGVPRIFRCNAALINQVPLEGSIYDAEVRTVRFFLSRRGGGTDTRFTPI